MSETTVSGGPPPENEKGRGAALFGSALTGILNTIGAALMAGLMLLTFCDVVSREVFNEPFEMTTDVTRLMLAAVVYAVLPVISRLEQHVGVDLLDRWMPKWFARPRQCAINLLAAIIFGVMCWQLFLLSLEKIEYNDLTEFVELPLYPIFFFMSALAAATSIALLYNAYRYLIGRSRSAAVAVNLIAAVVFAVAAIIVYSRSPETVHFGDLGALVAWRYFSVFVLFCLFAAIAACGFAINSRGKGNGLLPPHTSNPAGFG